MKLDVLAKSDNSIIQKNIISKIRDLINLKNLEPGDKLPSERMLSEKFEVSRGNVREAIQKLEFYGLLKSIPQSGTFVANIGVIAMNGMIDDILRLEEPEFKSLVETRILLELKTVRLASTRRTAADLEMLLFHLAIAKASGNSTMNNFMLIIIPEIITNFQKYHVCDAGLSKRGITDHQAIFDAIKSQDPQLAKQKMKDHFKELYVYCYNLT